MSVSICSISDCDEGIDPESRDALWSIESSGVRATPRSGLRDGTSGFLGGMYGNPCAVYGGGASSSQHDFSVGDAGGVGNGFLNTGPVGNFGPVIGESSSCDDLGDDESAQFLTSASSGSLTCRKYNELCTSCAFTTRSLGFRGVRKTSLLPGTRTI